MTESLNAIKEIIDNCSESERKALGEYLRKLYPHPLEQTWQIDSNTILTAIERSSDLTKRGVRGIIAEAIFVNQIIPEVTNLGWHNVPIVGDHPYDVLLEKGDRTIRIQVKLQRLLKAKPWLYYPKHYGDEYYVVEVQKTRSGKKKDKATRPYRVGDFDILAVNMHPSSHDWNSFRYTLGAWLLPREADSSLIEIMQPVAATPNDTWTDSLARCLTWYEEAKHHRVLSEVLHRKRSRQEQK